MRGWQSSWLLREVHPWASPLCPACCVLLVFKWIAVFLFSRWLQSQRGEKVQEWGPKDRDVQCSPSYPPTQLGLSRWPQPRSWCQSWGGALVAGDWMLGRRCHPDTLSASQPPPQCCRTKEGQNPTHPHLAYNPGVWWPSIRVGRSGLLFFCEMF